MLDGRVCGEFRSTGTGEHAEQRVTKCILVCQASHAAHQRQPPPVGRRGPPSDGCPSHLTLHADNHNQTARLHGGTTGSSTGFCPSHNGYNRFSSSILIFTACTATRQRVRNMRRRDSHASRQCSGAMLHGLASPVLTSLTNSGMPVAASILKLHTVHDSCSRVSVPVAVTPLPSLMFRMLL
jgi:hypothetical protein